MTHSGTDPDYKQLHDALEVLGDQVWQHANDALLPDEVMQYLWTNFPSKISEASLVLACTIPGKQQADAIRQLSQRGGSDVLPILAHVEKFAEFAADVRQEAYNAQQRITAHLERKARKHAGLPIGAEETLDNYSGYVCATLNVTSVGMSVATVDAPLVMVQDTIVVWLDPLSPGDTWYEPVLVRNGKDSEEVLFDLLLDSDEVSFDPQRYSIPCRLTTPSDKLRFNVTADASRQRVYWLNVFQKNRLIQILEIVAANVE